MLQTGGGFNLLTSTYLTKLFSHFISVSRATQFRKWKQHISGSEGLHGEGEWEKKKNQNKNVAESTAIHDSNVC